MRVLVSNPPEILLALVVHLIQPAEYLLACLVIGILLSEFVGFFLGHAGYPGSVRNSVLDEVHSHLPETADFLHWPVIIFVLRHCCHDRRHHSSRTSPMYFQI